MTTFELERAKSDIETTARQMMAAALADKAFGGKRAPEMIGFSVE